MQHAASHIAFCRSADRIGTHNNPELELGVRADHSRRTDRTKQCISQLIVSAPTTTLATPRHRASGRLVIISIAIIID